MDLSTLKTYDYAHLKGQGKGMLTLGVFLHIFPVVAAGIAWTTFKFDGLLPILIPFALVTWAAGFWIASLAQERFITRPKAEKIIIEGDSLIHLDLAGTEDFSAKFTEISSVVPAKSLFGDPAKCWKITAGSKSLIVRSDLGNFSSFAADLKAFTKIDFPPEFGAPI